MSEIKIRLVRDHGVISLCCPLKNTYIPAATCASCAGFILNETDADKKTMHHICDPDKADALEKVTKWEFKGEDGMWDVSTHCGGVMDLDAPLDERVCALKKPHEDYHGCTFEDCPMPDKRPGISPLEHQDRAEIENAAHDEYFKQLAAEVEKCDSNHDITQLIWKELDRETLPKIIIDEIKKTLVNSLDSPIMNELPVNMFDWVLMLTNRLGDIVEELRNRPGYSSLVEEQHERLSEELSRIGNRPNPHECSIYDAFETFIESLRSGSAGTLPGNANMSVEGLNAVWPINLSEEFKKPVYILSDQCPYATGFLPCCHPESRSDGLLCSSQWCPRIVQEVNKDYFFVMLTKDMHKELPETLVNVQELIDFALRFIVEHPDKARITTEGEAR